MPITSPPKDEDSPMVPRFDEPSLDDIPRVIDQRTKLRPFLDKEKDRKDQSDPFARKAIDFTEDSSSHRSDLDDMLKQLGVKPDTSTGSLILCNLLDIEQVAARFYKKTYYAKLAANNLSDMKIYFETRFPEVITTISSASALSARLGLLRLGEILSEMVFKHQLPPVVAQAFTMYVLMTDDKHEKLAISKVFFEAYLQLYDSEVTHFLDCCKDGMDLETLAILQQSGTSPDIRDAPGIKRLNPL